MKRYFFVAAAASVLSLTGCSENKSPQTGPLDANHAGTDVYADSSVVNQGEGGSGTTAGTGNDIDRQGQNGRTEGQKASDAINQAGDAVNQTIDSTLKGKNP